MAEACEFCDRVFRSATALHTHRWQVHGQRNEVNTGSASSTGRSGHTSGDPSARSSTEPQGGLHSSIPCLLRTTIRTANSAFRMLPQGILEFICILLGFRDVEAIGTLRQVHVRPIYRPGEPVELDRRHYLVEDLRVTLFDTLCRYFWRIATDLRRVMSQARGARQRAYENRGRTERHIRSRNLYSENGWVERRRQYVFYDRFGEAEGNRSSGDSPVQTDPEWESDSS